MVASSEDVVPAVGGFSLSGIISDSEVRGFLFHTLPKHHLSRIRAVTYVDAYKSTLREQDPLDVILTRGVYSASSHNVDQHTGAEQIEVYRQSPSGSHDPQFMKLCLAHEVGHSVYQNLPSRLKQQWRSVSRSATVREALSQRGVLDESEDFCESYAAYFLDREQLIGRSPEKFHFFETFIGH